MGGPGRVGFDRACKNDVRHVSKHQSMGYGLFSFATKGICDDHMLPSGSLMTGRF
jgi:hypothetical protein